MSNFFFFKYYCNMKCSISYKMCQFNGLTAILIFMNSEFPYSQCYICSTKLNRILSNTSQGLILFLDDTYSPNKNLSRGKTLAHRTSILFLWPNLRLTSNQVSNSSLLNLLYEYIGKMTALAVQYMAELGLKISLHAVFR